MLASLFGATQQTTAHVVRQARQVSQIGGARVGPATPARALARAGAWPRASRSIDAGTERLVVCLLLDRRADQLD